MKLRKIAALFLALALLPLPAALASVALGTEVHESVQTLGSGTQLHTGRLWSSTYSDLRTEQYLTYTPNPDVTPVVAWGSTVQAKHTLAEMARGLEGYGGRVLGGVNGDYFVVASGVPLGLTVTGGILRTGSSYHNGIGFLPDGTVFIGAPGLRMGLLTNGSRIGIGEMNKTRTVELGVHLFTSDFGPNTQNSQPGIDVILTPVAEPPFEESGLPYATEARIGHRILCTVDAVLQSEREINIPKGSFVLSANGKCNPDLLASLEALAVGETATIEIAASDPRWAEAVSAVGAFRRLLTAGVVSPDLDATQNPRTAVGVRDDGTAVFYTIDGRQPGHSVGATMKQVADRLLELGCVDAVLLDGGGSTMLGTTAAIESKFSVKNRSSDGTSGRRVTNAIFLVSYQPPTDELGSIVLAPGDAMLLAGARLPLKTYAIDTAHHPMYPFSGALFETEGGGQVGGDGLLTAPTERAVVTVTARYGHAEGTGTYTVVSTPDHITLSTAAEDSVSAVNLDPGETVDLNAAAAYRNLPLLASDDCFIWSVTPEVGRVDANGVFTAGSKGASGRLTVTAGERTLSIPVSVAGHVLELEDFEGTADGFLSTDECSAVPEGDPVYVKFGTQSMRLDYNAAAGLAQVAAHYPIAAGEEYLSVWVYGDGSGGALEAIFEDDALGLQSAEITTLDFIGWRQLLTPIPEDAVRLARFCIGQAEGDDGVGSIWLDQITTMNQYVIDVEPPTIALSMKNGVLTAKITDAVDKQIGKGQLSFQIDGWLLDFNWNPATGTLTATLPALSDGMHRVTVTAADRSGNLDRASADIPATAAEHTPPFVDTLGHWAEPYARYLHREGVALGSPGEGGTVFLPDDNIRRGEFFLLVARFLRVDFAQYAEVALPFADADAIPDWALPGIRAMVALGIVKGSAEAGGVYVFSEHTLTRAEAMTILGRIQDKGYPSAALDFSDAADIPPWALAYMQTLTAQGVVSGYEGRVRPGDPIRRGEVAKLLYTMR